MSRFVACAAIFFLVLSCIPAAAGPVTLLSRADPDRPSDTAGGTSEIVGLSSSSQFAAFLSDADNLVSGVADDNAARDVFLHDRIAGTTVLVSHAAGDLSTASSGAVLGAVMSADGRWVVFLSQATDLVAGQVDGALTTDVFLWDRNTGVTVLVSHRQGLPATAAGGGTGKLAISADGGEVAFLSTAPDLVAGQSDGAATPDLFLYDRATGANTLVSHTAGSATTAAGSASEPGLSANGSRLVFVSSAANLFAGQVDSNGGEDVFLYDQDTGGTVLVSHAAGAAATAGSSLSFLPQISADGSRIAYQSFAVDLQAGQVDVNGFVGDDVFLYDCATGINTLVSHALVSAFQTGNGPSRNPDLSADGRSVAFLSSANDLNENQGTGYSRSLLVFDHVTGVNTLVNQSLLFSDIIQPRISADGAWVAYMTDDSIHMPDQIDTPFTWDVFLWSRASGIITLVTHEPGSTTTTAGNSALDLRIDATGSWIALSSLSPRLVAGAEDHNTLADVFLYERATRLHTLVTTRDGAVSALAGSSYNYWTRAMPSNDGRRITFTSGAPNLPVPGLADDNDASDVFLWDRVTSAMTLMSHRHGLPATTGNGASFDPVLSADGRVAVFLSDATDLVPGQDGSSRLSLEPVSQLFLSALGTTETTLVSHAAGLPGNPADGWASGIAAVSGDGRWIAYTHNGSDLVAGQGVPLDVNVFLFDRTTGTNTLVSHASSSPTQPANGFSNAPSISADGRYVAFWSSAPDLVPGQNGGIFLYDRVTGSVAAVASSGVAPLAISADGRQVVFTSNAGNVVPGQVDGNSGTDVFLWDRVSGSIRLVSRSLASPTTTGNLPSGLGTTSDNPPVVSADGRWVVFASSATNLVAGQPPGHPGVFLFDRIAGTVSLVSRWAAAPAPPSSPTSQPAISADGRFVAYLSEAHDLVPGQIDQLATLDYFLFDRVAGTTALVSHVPASEVTSGRALPDALREAPWLSADGAWVTFASMSPDLAANDHDGTKDAFLYANLLPGRDFFSVSACRILDTRQAGQGPALTSGLKRTMVAHGSCGIPETARSIAVNVTVTQPTAAGFLTFHAGDLAPETISTINFAPGQTRSNNAILPLSFDGRGLLAVTPLVGGNGTVHLIVDVSGWFE